MSEPEILYVEDTNCTPRHEVRTHEIVIDDYPKPVTFKYREKVMLPYAEAMKFTVDGAFRVTDEDGKVYEPVKKPRDTSVPVALAANEVVAELHELTQEALLRRAAIKPGGEKLSKSTKKDTIIDFLQAAYAVERTPGRDADAPEADASGEAMDMDEVDSVLDGVAA